MYTTKQRTNTLILTFGFWLLAFSYVEAQRTFSIKNNLFYDATLTPNLGMEMAVGRRSSLQLFYGLNPWHGYHGQKRLQHWSLMPEYRYWLSGKTFRGWFTGLHAVGGEYNVAGLQLPFRLFETLRHSHYEGWYAGGGLTIGHAWQLSRHWNLEAALGIGYVHTRYSHYENEACGDLLCRGHYNYAGPTKLALNLAYVFGKDKPMEKPQPEVPQPVVIVSPPMPATAGVQIAPLHRLKRVRKVWHLSGRAWLDFRVNKTDIDPLYRRNRAELDSVMQTIYVVANDTNVSITHITIHGYASPEGKLDNNQRLAEGRAEALKQYIQARTGMADRLFTIETTAEDWEALRQALDSRPDLPQRDDILALMNREIEAGTDLDRLEYLIRIRYPKGYQVMKDDIYPALRHSDYTVTYNVQEYYTEEIIEK